MSNNGPSPAGVMRAGAALLLILISLISLPACRHAQNPATQSEDTTPTTGASINLNGAGATFPYPLYSKWFDVYSQNNPNIHINYQSIGSGGGIKQLQAGTVDFGASDAPLSDAETKAMPKPVVHLPMVAGAVALAYNLPNVATGLKLSSEVIAGIFFGEIKRWNDPRIVSLNPDIMLPNTAVAVAHRSDGSGTTYIFTHYLAAISKTWATKVGSGKSVNWPVGIGGKGNEGVAGVLTQTPGSIGYVELAYATQNKLPYAAIRNLAGQFVSPSVALTTAAAAGAVKAMQQDIRVSIVNAVGKDAYPISGFTYILLYKEQPDQAKGTALVNFLRWAIHDGQQYAAPLVYAPLPAEVVTIDEHTLAAITHDSKPLQVAK